LTYVWLALGAEDDADKEFGLAGREVDGVFLVSHVCFRLLMKEFWYS